MCVNICFNFSASSTAKTLICAPIILTFFSYIHLLAEDRHLELAGLNYYVSESCSSFTSRSDITAFSHDSHTICSPDSVLLSRNFLYIHLTPATSYHYPLIGLQDRGESSKWARSISSINHHHSTDVLLYIQHVCASSVNPTNSTKKNRKRFS